MKLHLPTRLRAAVLACITAVAALATTVGTGALTTGVVAYTIAASQAEAREATTATTVAGDTTYNGYVYTMLLDKNVTFHERNFALATYVGGAWTDGETIYAGNASAETPLGTGIFWTQYCATGSVTNGIDYYGNTLHLVATSAQVKLSPSFTDFCLGGLIVEKGSMSGGSADTTAGSAYWFYRGGSMQFNGAGNVNMDIADHVRFSYANEVAIKKSGVWNIASTGSIAFDNNSQNTPTTLKLEANQHVTIQGGGKVNIGRNGTYNMSLAAGSVLEVNGSTMAVAQGTTTIEAGAALTIGEGSVVTHSSVMNAAGTINNSGALTMAATNLTGSIVNAAAGSSLTLTGALTFDVTNFTTASAPMLDVSKGTFDYSGGSLALTGDTLLADGEYTLVKAADETAAAAIATVLTSSLHTISNDGDVVKLIVASTGMETLTEDLVGAPNNNFHKVCVNGLDVGEHTITATYSAAGYSTLYTKDLKGSGNITFNRTNGGNNLCVLWIDGDATEYTGTIAMGNLSNAYLKLGSANGATDLSNATVNMTKEVIALGNNATIGTLTANQTEIRAVDGTVDNIANMSTGMQASTAGFAQAGGVIRKLTITTSAELTSTTLNSGVTLAIAQGASVTLAGGTMNGLISNSGALNLSGALTLNGPIMMGADSSATFANDVQLDLSRLTADEGVYHILDGAGTSNLSALSVDNLTGIVTAGYQWTFNDNGTISAVSTSSDLVWNVAAGTWDTTTTNWLSGSTAAAYTAADSVTFGYADATVTLAGDVTPTNMSVTENTTFTGSGEISFFGTFAVAEGKTMTINDGVSILLDSAETAEKVFASAVAGEGSLHLATDYSYTDAAKNPVATAKLTIDSGKTLSVGNSDSRHLSISSFSAIDLAGTIKYQNKKDTVNNLSVASGATATLASVDMGNAADDVLQLAGSTKVNGTLNILNYWNGEFAIDALSGAGTVLFGGMSGPDNMTLADASNEAVSTTIADMSGFSGTLKVRNEKLTLTFTESFESTATIDYSRGGKVVFSGEGNVYSIKTVTNTESNNYSRFLTVDSGVTVKANSLHNGWGFGALTVNGTLEIAGTLSYATGGNGSTSNNLITGTGTIKTQTLRLGNAGTYNFSGVTLEIGAGGIEINNNWNPITNLGKMTIAATENWTNTYNEVVNLTSTEGTTFRMDANGGLTSAIGGDGALIKTGVGSLSLGGASTYAGGTTVSQGTLIASVASALGTGAVTVEADGAVDLKLGNVLGADQTLTNSGTVTLHNTLTQGTIANEASGTIVIATDFAGLESAGIVGIDGGADGNGFKKGGTATIFSTPGAITGNLEASFNGESVTIAEDGTATLDDDYSTYHINNALLSTETFSAITAGAAAHDATLSSIDVAVADQTLTVDGAGMATSMLEGAHVATATLAVAGGQTLTVDADTAASISTAADATVTADVTTNATVGTLALGAGTTLNVTGTGTLTSTTAVTDSLTVNTADGAGLKLTSVEMGTGETFTTTGEGTLTLTSTEQSKGLRLDGGSAVLNGSVNVLGSLYLKTNNAVATLNIAEGAFVTAGRVESGDSAGGNAATITVASGATLKVTGSDAGANGNSESYKQSGLVLGEWASGTNLNVSGLLMAENATMQPGDNSYVLTIAESGTVAVKGLGNPTTKKGTDKTQGITANVNGGKLILGEGGINSTHEANTTLTDGTIGISADAVTIAHGLALAGTTGNTLDTAKYSFTDTGVTQGTDGGTLAVSGIVSGEGKLIKAGAGKLTLSGANTYSGGTAVNDGTLSITSSAGLGTGAVTVAGGVLTLDAADTISMGGLSMTSGSIKLAGAEKLAITGAVTLSGGTLDFTNVTVAEAVGHTVLGTVSGDVNVSDVTLAGLSEAILSQYNVSVMKNDGNLVLSLADKSAPLFWNGGSGTWDSTASNTVWGTVGDDVSAGNAYAAGAQVTISGTEGGTITVSGAQTAGSLTIAQPGYTITRGGNSDSLTVTGDLTVNEGVTANLGFLPTVNGNIVLNSGSELTFAASVTRPGTETILSKATGEGTVKLTGGSGFDADANRVSISNRTVTANTQLAVSGDMAVNGWTSNTQTGATGSFVLTKTSTVEGELRMETGAKLVIADGVSLTAGKLGLGHADEKAMAVGHLEMTGGNLSVGAIALNNNQANTMNVSGGTLTITGANAFTGTGTATTVNVGAATIKNGETDMAFNHASTLTGTTISAQNDKTITVGGTGMTTTLAGAITTEGKVTLAGTLDTTGLTALNNSGVLTITGDSVELKGSVLNNTGTLATTGALTLTDAATVGGTVNAGSLTLTGANTFDAITTTGAVTIGNTLNVTGLISAGSVALENVSLTAPALTAGGAAGNALALTADTAQIATVMGANTTLTLANVTGLTSATINGGTTFKEGSRDYTLSVAEGVVTITAEISDQFIWNAAAQGSVWGDASSWEGDVQPTETSNVVFNGTGIADVTIAGNAVAGNIFVESDANFITQGTGSVATGGIEVSAGTLTVGEGVTVNATGTTSVVNDGVIIIAGTLNTDTLAATGKDVQLSGTLTVDTEGAVNSIGGIGGDYGHLIVGTETSFMMLDLVEDTLTIAADSTVDDLTIKNTGNLDAKGTFTVNNTAEVAVGGVMTVAKDLTISDDLTNAGSITVGSAAAPATLATEDVTNSGTITVFNTMTSTGDVDNQTGATLDVKGNLTANTAGKTVTNAGNLQVGGTANAAALTTTDGSTTTVKGNTTIAGALNNGGTLTVGTQAAPAMLATGDVVNNGTITVYNTMTSTGDVTNNAGKTLDVKGNLTANTAGKTVSNEGTMTIGGIADVATLTTGDEATSTIKGNATVATALTNAGSTTIDGALTATNAAVTNEATGAGEKLTVKGALAADTLTTAAGATTEAKGGATLGSELANHGTTTVTGDLASANATAPITITNDATGAGEKLTVTGNVTAKSLTTETGATTDITGTGKTVTLTDSLTNKGTTTIKGALTSADATATDPGSLSIENTGTLSTGKLTADSLSGNGATTVTGNATMKKLNLGTTGSLTASGTVKTDSVSSTGGSVTADTLDLSGLTAAATIADVKADKITLSGFNMLKVTDSISNENGTGAAKVMLSLDAATMSTLSVGDEKVVVATDGSVAGQGITLGNLAAVNSALKAYGIKGAMVTTAAGELVMQMQDNSFVSQIATSENGKTGAEMVDAASAAGLATAGTALGDIYAALDACRTTGDAATGDRIAAAVTGSSIAAMGAALSGDVERQLRAIRNRTTTMGVNQGVINEDMPYFNAWVNAEGDYRKVAADGTLAGYKMTSWGGTVGMDVDVTPRFTCGLAATAMYGDFDADGTDSASGDIDTYYVSAFARYAKHRWTHTFVATVGLAETSLERTILGHTVKGDSDGMMFGGMYEVGYVFALDKEATTCLQPVLNVSYTHATLNGYDESGANAALSAGDVEFNKLTVGAGARLQSVVGENIYNRSSILEARALVKFDAGDRQGEADVTFAGSGLPTHTTKSSETGAIGAEIGVGLTVPVGSAGGSIFADASAEIRAEYTNVNATVGYRVNF